MHPLSPAEILYEEQHIHDDRRKEMTAAFSVMIVLAFAAVALRLIARRIMNLRLKADDYSILAALVNGPVLSCSLILMIISRL